MTVLQHRQICSLKIGCRAHAPLFQVQARLSESWGFRVSCRLFVRHYENRQNMTLHARSMTFLARRMTFEPRNMTRHPRSMGFEPRKMAFHARSMTFEARNMTQSPRNFKGCNHLVVLQIRLEAGVAGNEGLICVRTANGSDRIKKSRWVAEGSSIIRSLPLAVLTRCRYLISQVCYCPKQGHYQPVRFERSVV